MELSRAAASLLLFYLLNGPPKEPRPAIEEMKGAGIPDRTRFFKAREELEKAGYISYKRDGKRGTLTLDAGLLRTLSTSIVGWLGVAGEGNGVVPASYLSIYLEGSCAGSTSGVNGTAYSEVLNTNTSEVLDFNTPEVLDTNTSPSEVLNTNTPEAIDDVLNTNTTQTEVLNTNTSLLDRCISVDEMDDTGPETSRNSPFQKRRAAQIPLIQEAWKQFYPQDAYPLSKDNARQFLSWCSNSAETCYERLEELSRKKPAAPVAYVRASLKGKAEETRPALKKQPAPSTSVVGKGEEVGTPWDGDLMEPSAAWLEKRRKALEYAQQAGWRE